MHQSDDSLSQELEAMSAHLSDYLLGDRLYKTISVHGPQGERLIKMTLGGMLERIAELGTTPGGRAATEALAQAQRTLPEPFFEMLGREAKSYTDSWNWFLQNCWEGDARCRSDYAQEVGIRLRLERLLEVGGEHAALADSRQRLQSLDQRLRAIWQEGDGPLVGKAGSYPRDRYWWLYGEPTPEMTE